MSFNKLPIEIIEKIFKEVEYNDILQLRQVNKEFNAITNNQIFWKNKLKIDFNGDITSKFFKCEWNNWKEYYTQKYNNNCRNCLRKTKVIHYFYNKRICKNCIKNIDEFKLISQTKCYSMYYLNTKDLQLLKYHQNNLHSSNSKKKYLLKEVKSKCLEKFSNPINFILYDSKILNKKISKNIKIHIKKLLFERELRDKYNIILNNISYFLDYYTNGYYTKYLRNIGKNVIFRKEFLIRKCLELEFIRKYSFDFIITRYNCNFYKFLLDFLLFEKNEIITVNIYIQNKIEFLKEIHKEKFDRKKIIIKELDNNRYIGSYRLNDKIIIDYIYNNVGNVEDIVYELIIENFIQYCKNCLTIFNINTVNIPDIPITYHRKIIVELWILYSSMLLPSLNFYTIIDNLPEQVKHYIKSLQISY